MKIAQSLVSVFLACFTLDQMDGDAWGIFKHFLPVQLTIQNVRCICYIQHSPSGKTEIPPEEDSLTEKGIWWHFTVLHWRSNQNPWRKKKLWGKLLEQDFS